MIRIFADYEALSRAAANHVVLAGKRCAAERGRFDWVLAGGATPRTTYQAVAELTQEVPGFWQHTHLYWGDERLVPGDHPDSNYHMTKSCLLNLIDIPPEQIHRIPGEAPDAHAAARRYQADFPARPDLLMLGVGGDGHIASLFPGSPLLGERDSLLAVAEAPVEPRLRITVTPPVLTAVRQVVVLVSGPAKAAALRRVFSQEGGIDQTPARLVRGATWFVDQQAAKEIIELGVVRPI